MLLQMKPSDLGGLYALLDMYQNIYGPAGDNLLAEIAGNYKISAACYCPAGGKILISYQSRIQEAQAGNAGIFRKNQRRYASYANQA